MRRQKVMRGFLGVLLLLTSAGAPDSGQRALAEESAPAAQKPLPEKAKLPPSQIPLEVLAGERIAFVGSSTAERMNLFGYFEALLHSRFPTMELVVRNFARPADEVANRQRSNDYTAIDDPLAVFNPDTFFCFFGFNESYAGVEKIEKFKADYEAFLDEFAKKYPRDETKAAPRFVLISPIAFEPTGDRLLPDGKEENARLKLYAQAVKEVAAKRGLAFVDLFTPTETLFTAKHGCQYTINGCHQNEAGDREIAVRLDRGLFSGDNPADMESEKFKKLRDAVNDKSWVHQQDYRMLNGWYVYGGRRTWDTETYPREYAKIRQMAAVRDRYAWYIAQDKPVPSVPNDESTGELIVPKTRFGDPRQKYSEAEELRYLTPEELVKSSTVPKGFEIQPFADETKFPEIAKPVQISFDSKGRLWISTMPSYPHWRPGDPRPSDKLVILEDTDGDTKADKSTIFYDKLQCPTGFEFFRDGVIVVDQPRILFLRDTDGDDRADEVTYWLDGFANDDTHHTVGAFESNHGGLLHMQEGVAMSTAVETPWGPFRNFGSPGSYVLDPAALRLRHFVTPGYGNPWCYVFNEWGQGIVGDGTTAVQHWDTPLSGAQFGGRQGLNPVFNTEGMRPVVGSDFLVSRNFPKEMQGQFIYACVINMNGIPRFEIHDDGAGYAGSRVKKDGQPDDLLRSTDKHFRPVDPQIGPDGALWFGDWSNALIGHMQYSQRDPNRDHQRGRIYRLVNRDLPLVPPVTQSGKPVAELLEQFRLYEWRTRERARRELHRRPADEVLPAVASWVAGLDPKDADHDRLLTEALWVQQGHHAVDGKLLLEVLAAPAFQARAAATRIAADQGDLISGSFEILKAMAVDKHPRVRTEAIRGLSFYPNLEGVEAVLAASKLPMDYWVHYTLDHALAANEAVWRQAFLTGTLKVEDGAPTRLLNKILVTSKAGGMATPYLRTLLAAERKPDEERTKAMQALADMKGNAENGRQVFLRTCTACHKVGDQGREFGPNLASVLPKRTRVKLVESLIDPNAEVEEKYLSTLVVTTDGNVTSGLLVRESPEELVIFDGKMEKKIAKSEIEERKVQKQSSMPEGLAGAMAPIEFIDVIEFLSTLK
ncbi:MAG: PVC-type heme-binding CxxCH protein [Planctomycetota bacterium]